MRYLLAIVAVAGCGTAAHPPPTGAPQPAVTPPVAATTHAGCDGAVLPGPTELARDARGPRPVGVHTVELDGMTTEVWYPAAPGSDAGAPAVRYDPREQLAPADAAKIPDADNAWLPCDCARDLPVDDALGPLPVVVFFHGAASFRSQSVTLATHWASRGYVVIAPDLPGVGLRSILGGSMEFPFDVPAGVVATVTEARAVDPLAFVRPHLGRRLVLAGHSLGAVLTSTAAEQPVVAGVIMLAGALGLALDKPALAMNGDRDGIVAYAPRRAAAAEDTAPAHRFIGVRGAGHLAFTDLCGLGADRGGALAIAAAHGLSVPPFVQTAGRDGCGADAAPIADTTPRILAATTAFLDETLACGDATATWQALAADPQLDVVGAR